MCYVSTVIIILLCVPLTYIQHGYLLNQNDERAVCYIYDDTSHPNLLPHLKLLQRGVTANVSVDNHRVVEGGRKFRNKVPS